MGYYVRAFCISDKVPPLDEVEQTLRKTLPLVRFETEDPRDSVDWRNAELFYSDSRSPIVVEIGFDDGPESLASAERREFIDELSEIEGSAAKERVIAHLRSVKYVVCCQLLGDIDEEGFEANGQFLDYFVGNHRGLIQADGEGFYEGTDLAVELK